LIFPLVLLLLLVVLGAFKVSGSSVGAYYRYFYGNKKDTSLVFGYPQPVRGDEWNTVTPILLSQAKNNYSIQNPSIGQGEDTSVLLDVPYKNWLIILKPWNMWFLFLPLATAFALKWWTLLFLLGIATYFLVLSQIPKRYLTAALFAIFLMLSPFVQWWYRDYLLATIAFAFLGLLFAMQLSNKKLPNWQKITYTIGLGYTMAVFVFIEYPPFQIMTAFAAGLFYIGFLYRQGLFRKSKLRQLGNLGAWLVTAICVALVPLGAYYVQHRGAIKAVLNTAFPGRRLSMSGQGKLGELVHLLTGPFSAELQRHTNAAVTYFGNQSEAAVFMQYSVLICMPLIFDIVQYYQKTKKIKWDFLLLVIGMIAIYLYMFVPGLTGVYGVLLFNRVPLARLELGVGLLDLFALLLLVREHLKKPMPQKPALIIAGVTTIGLLLAGFYTRNHYPGFLADPFIIIVASLWMGLVLFLLTTKHQVIGLTMLVALSVVSVYRVNPLYVGLSPLNNTPLATTIQRIAKSHSSKEWVNTDFTLQEYPQANGAKSLTGDYSYPQSQIWRTVDANPKDNYIYNRATHVLASISGSNSLSLPSVNLITFHINPCSQLVNQLNIGYLLTTHAQSNSCLVLTSKITFPAVTTYIYSFRPTQS
jgi:hypothetical protein